MSGRHGQRFRRPSSKRSSTPALLLLLAACLALATLISVEVRRLHVSQGLATSERLSRPVKEEPKTQRPIDYMLHYASVEAADYPEDCRQRYHGMPFLQTINSSWQQPVCTPQDSGPLRSSIRCWFQFDQYAEAYCTGANLALDLGKFKEEEAAMPHAVNNRNEQQLFQEHPRPGVTGELLGDCKLHGMIGEENKWQDASFGKGAQRWLFRSFRSTIGDTQQPECVAWVDHPVYFLNDKYDSINLWHAMEDVTHAFEAYALKGWGNEAQVVVFDEVDEDSVLGPTYLAVWRKAFSPKRPPITLRKLVAQYSQQHGGELPPHAAVCFRDVMFNVHGGISLLSRSIGSWTPCHNSTTVNAMVHFVLDGLQLSDIKPASHSGLVGVQPGQQQGGEGDPSRRMRVVWALRSNRAGFQKEVLDALQQRVPAEAGAEVMAVEFGALSVEEQIRRVRQADILVGYHGAALTLACFMNWHSGLVEIEESFRCTCYTNCAMWRDHPYSLIRAGGEANAAALAAKVVDEVVKMLQQIQQRLASS